MHAKFWVMEPVLVKVIILVSFGVFLSAVVRLLRLAFRLYRPAGSAVLLEHLAQEKFEPDDLAAYALTARAPLETLTARPVKTSAPSDRATKERTALALRSAESKFLYLCEQSWVDVNSTSRAGWLILLLSFLTAAYGALPTYFQFCEDTNRTVSQCLFESADQVLLTFTLELSMCIIVYLASGFVKRKLGAQRASWLYLFAKLKSEFPGN